METVSLTRAWWLAFRPKTLTAAFVPVAVGSLYAASLGPARWDLAGFGLLAALCIQVGTNLFNDALDFEKGTDREDRLGPRRATHQGWLTPRGVWAGAWVAFALALVASYPLVVERGGLIVVIAFASLLSGYLYTGGPAPLSYVGLGDLFVVLFFGLVAVMGTVYLHRPDLALGGWPLGLQVGLLAMVLIAINNLRDIESDRKSNKRTLAVRFGPTFARWEITLSYLLCYGVGLVWISRGHWGTGLFPLAVSPLCLKLVGDIWREPPSRRYNQFLARAALIQLVFGLLLCLGFFWGLR